jgi:hypothetical protein
MEFGLQETKAEVVHYCYYSGGIEQDNNLKEK